MANNKLDRTYFPNPVPKDSKDLLRFIEQEFELVAIAIQALGALQVSVAYKEPLKPQIGEIKIADGVFWNPGGGAGAYIYLKTGWKLIALE